MTAFFSKQDMSDLLVTAFEGGSNYWIQFVEYQMPPGMTKADLRRAAWDAMPDEEKRLWKEEGPTGRWPLYVALPYLPPSVQWAIKIKPFEDEAVLLTPENMRQAAAEFAKRFPQAFRRVKEGDFDAGDADAWLQTAVFGEVVYG